MTINKLISKQNEQKKKGKMGIVMKIFKSFKSEAGNPLVFVDIIS